MDVYILLTVCGQYISYYTSYKRYVIKHKIYMKCSW